MRFLLNFNTLRQNKPKKTDFDPFFYGNSGRRNSIFKISGCSSALPW
jgi:hypothetical protein